MAISRFDMENDVETAVLRDGTSNPSGQTKGRRYVVAGVALATTLTCLLTNGQRATAETQARAGRLPVYPTTVYQGPISIPKLQGPNNPLARFKTIITREVKSGPNFAGYLRIIEIGCGSGCLNIQLIDVRHGTMIASPLASENPYAPGLSFRVNDRLLVARWESAGETDDSKRCINQAFVWNGSGFDRVGPRKSGPEQICLMPLDN